MQEKKRGKNYNIVVLTVASVYNEALNQLLATTTRVVMENDN